MKKKVAEESEKIRKARDKIKKRLDSIEKNITVDALKKKNEEIHTWISRHASGRISLKEKNISLFDENQNTASLSKYVCTMLKKLQDMRIAVDLKKKNIIK